MTSLLVWIVLVVTVPCFGSYRQIRRHLDVKPLPEEDGAKGMFLRMDSDNGADCIYPSDCQDVLNCGRTKSGVYRVFPYGIGEGILVSCDMVSEGGGWLVIHRRLDGSVDFYRNWQNYTDGFGNLAGEFWMGLEKIHLMTSQRKYELLVNMGSFNGSTRYALYSRFFVSDSKANYRLLVQGFSGNAGDSLLYHNGREFTTYDMDHDSASYNCAINFKGAWWYGHCHDSNLNGEYIHRDQPVEENTVTMSWKTWDNYKPLQLAEIMIRPRRRD